MTTLPGGPADELGNRYEKLWTIAELLNMLMGLSDIADAGKEFEQFER